MNKLLEKSIILIATLAATLVIPFIYGLENIFWTWIFGLFTFAYLTSDD